MQDSIIFKAAILMPAQERAAYLDRACGVNAALRLEVEGLLRAHEQPGDFMFRPPIADMATDYRPGPDRPGTRIGPYKLLQYLGEGGMGTVFLAEQSQPVRRMVALKIMKPGMDSTQVLARFEAERQALAIMDHPNIAKVFDAGTTQAGLELPAKPQNGTKHGTKAEGQNGTANGSVESTPPTTIPQGRPYFVMELIKGVPITEFCDKNKLNTRQRLELFVPVCNAIQHAHMKGIIHRDIKPSNVLIALYDGKPVPKVIDFGVAKAMSEPLTQRTMFTQIGQVVGTFEHMSPEQATLNQLDIDTRSDIYSLGVLLYELLTGMTPLNKDRLRTLALDQMLKTIREEEPVRPSVKLSSEAGALAVAAAYRNVPSAKLTGLLRGELDWIVMKCLEKERNRRFVTAGSLAEDIERYLRNEPVHACPPSLAYRAQKAYRKNKLAIAVTGIVAAALLLGTVVSIIFAVNAVHARRLAEAAEGEISKKHEIAEKAKEEAETERDKNATMVKKLSEKEEQRRRSQYDWDLQIMQTTFEAGRIGQMQQMLERHAEDLRGFEWNYWNKQIHNEIRSRIFGIVWDGKGTVPSKATTSIRESVSFAGPGGLRNDSIHWIMNEQGTRVACVSYEAGENLIDPATNRPFPQRTYFADVFDSADGRQLCHIPFIKRNNETNGLPTVSQLLLSRDGSKLAVGWSVTTRMISQGEKTATRTRRESFLSVMDVATKNTLYETNFGTEPDGGFGPGSANNTPVFFPDGKRLAMMVSTPRSRVDGQGPMAHVRIIDLQTQSDKEIGRFETAFINFGVRLLASQAISPDGTRLAYVKEAKVKDLTAAPANALMEYTLATVDTATGKEQHTWQFTAGAQGYLSLAFSPDSSRLAVAQAMARAPGGIMKFTYSLRDVETGKELAQEVTELESQTNPGGAILFNPSGKILYLRNGVYTANVIGKVWAFHADTGKPLAGFDGDFTLGEHYFSADGTRLYHLDANAVVIRDALTGKVVQTLRGHVQSITHLGLAPDGRTLSSLDNMGEYKVWRTTPERPIALRQLPESQSRRFAPPVTRLSPDGHYVVGIPEDENAPRPGTLAEALARQAGDITQLALWDAGNGRMQMLPMRPITERPKEEPNGDGSRTPLTDDKTLFSSNSRFVCLLRYRNYINFRGGTGRPTTNTQKNETAKTEDLSRYDFCDLTVWDTTTGQETAYLQPSFDEISRSPNYTVSLTPDGKTLVLSRNGGVFLYAYDLVSGRKLWSKAPGRDERGLAVGGPGVFMSPDGKTLLRLRRNEDIDAEGRPTARAQNFLTCELLETATGNAIRSFETPYEVSNNVVWSPDGKRVAVSAGRSSPVIRASNKLLRVFDVETGKLAMSLDAPPRRQRLPLTSDVQSRPPGSPDCRPGDATDWGTIQYQTLGLRHRHRTAQPARRANPALR